MTGARVLLFAGICALTLWHMAASQAGTCPEVPASTEQCTSLCSTHTYCSSSLRCCSNGCGDICMRPTGRTSLLVQMTTKLTWTDIYSTPSGIRGIKDVVSPIIIQYRKVLSSDYIDSTGNGTPYFRLVNNKGKVAIRMEFNHTDGVSRPEVVESRIAWLLKEKYDATDKSTFLKGKLNAIVRSSGRQLTVDIESVCSIFNAKATCRHDGMCVDQGGFPACRCTDGYSGWFCETKLQSEQGHSHSDGHNDSRESHSGSSGSEDTQDSRESSDDARKDHGSRGGSGDGDPPVTPQLPAWFTPTFPGDQGGRGSSGFPPSPGFPHIPPPFPTSHPGPSRCQPQIAIQCLNRLQTLVDYMILYNRKHTSQAPGTSWGALCGASFETARCIVNSTKDCNSKTTWKRFNNLVKPLNTICAQSSGATCNVMIGSAGFTELVKVNIERILNPYKQRDTFCSTRLTQVDSAIGQSILKCTPYITLHLADIIASFKDPLMTMCDTTVECQFGKPQEACTPATGCSKDNYQCISPPRYTHRNSYCCPKYETSESCNLTAVQNCFTKFAVKATVELTSVIPSPSEICSELNKTRSCVAMASVNCTRHVRTGLTALADTLQKHLDKAICVDTCSGNPCHNGGTCFARIGWYICVCTHDFTGSSCETRHEWVNRTSTVPTTTTVPMHPGKCPKPPAVFGTCHEECDDDDGCPYRSKCCSNGCGHLCMDAVFDTDKSTTPSTKSTTPLCEPHCVTPSTTTTSTTTTTTTAKPATSSSTTGSRQVVLVIRLVMQWKDSYENKENEATQDLITALETTLGGIYGSISGFRHVKVQQLFESSVGVKHLVEFDHDLSDTDRTIIGLVLTSALKARNNTLTIGNQTTGISGKREMLIGRKKVEVNDACFFYNTKHVCQNGGTCVADKTSASCVCAPGYAGIYCGATRQKTNNTAGIIVGIIIAVILVVIIVFCAVFLYRRKQQHLAKNEQMQLDGVENPTYAVSAVTEDFTSQAVDNPTYAG